MKPMTDSCNMQYHKPVLLIVCSLVFLLGYSLASWKQHGFKFAHVVNQNSLKTIDGFDRYISKAALENVDKKTSKTSESVDKYSLKALVDTSTYSLKILDGIGRNLYEMKQEIKDKMVVIDAFVKEYNVSCTEKSVTDGAEDLLCMAPPIFLQNYKNPCWYSETGAFRCLPYFLLIGAGKSASSDFFDKIIQHPDALGNMGSRGKETVWWSWSRYGNRANNLELMKKLTFEDYLDYFRESAVLIERDPQREYITGDGSAMDLSDNSGWPSIPQNNGEEDPKFTTAHLIKHMNPDVKLLVILRDPVERLYSDYYFRGVGNMTREDFHQKVVNAIHLLHTCTRNASLRACLYSRIMHFILPVRIQMGFYFIFLQDWFQVFPREQFLIIRTEDYSRDMTKDLQETYDFLGLRPLPPNRMEAIVTSRRQFVTKRKLLANDMKTETRKILQELYGDFNEHLARLLNDDRFKWASS